MIAVLAATAVVVAVVALTSCTDEQQQQQPPSAVILGDSITDWTSEYVEDRLTECGVIPTTIRALAARRIEAPSNYEGPVNSGTDEMDRIAAEGLDPTVWVIELGANDVASLTSVADARRLIDAVVAKTDPDDRVVWLTVHMTITEDQVELFNTALAESGVEIADWRARAVGQPWLTDWVHLNNAGAEQLAALYCEILATDANA
jgi:hypothetical protein